MKESFHRMNCRGKEQNILSLSFTKGKKGVHNCIGFGIGQIFLNFIFSFKGLMMRKFYKSGILALLLCAIIFSNAQSWEAITFNETFHYRLDTSDVIVTSLKMDSSRIENGIYVWYLNRQVKEIIPGQRWLKNGERFLQKKMLRLGNGVLNFRDPGNFTLYTLNPVGSSWLFDSVNTITAQIISANTQSVLGQMDSVKTILLSSGDTIVLSKIHGLLRFPFQYSSSHYYILTGIAGRNAGELLPTEEDIVADWHAGDVYMHNNYFFWGVTGETESGTTKITIDSVRYWPDSATYFYHSIHRKVREFQYVTIQTVSGNFTQVFSGMYTIDLLHHLPNEVYPSPNWNNIGINNCDSCKVYDGYFLHKNLFGINVSNALEANSNYPFILVELRSGSDTLTRLDWIQMQTFCTGIGEVAYSDKGFEWSLWRGFSGMVKNGDTIGAVYPDSWFVVDREKEFAGIEFEIFPNPVSEKISIRIKKSPHTIVTILDLHGKEIHQLEFSTAETQINISQLPPGIYFLRIETESGSATKKIIKNQ